MCEFKAYLATQFFGTLNDNAFKITISLLALKMITDLSRANKIISLAEGLLVLPFILFSAYAGFLADRYSKKNIIVVSKFLEIVVMSFGFLALSKQSLPFLLIVLFFMGTQSALFSPAKYGVLPEMVADEDLSSANGHLQIWTFPAIILGVACSGPLLKFCENNIGMAGIFFISIAVIGIYKNFLLKSKSILRIITFFKTKF